MAIRDVAEEQLREQIAPMGSRLRTTASSTVDDRRRISSIDLPYAVSSSYQRFNQKNTVFSRATWDPQITKWGDGRLLGRAVQRIVAGDREFTLMDYALRNAAWYVNNAGRTLATSEMGGGGLYSPQSRAYRSLASEPWKDHPGLKELRESLKRNADPIKLTKAVKKAARFLGASLVGIAEYDERWTYTHAWQRAIGNGRGKSVPIEMPEDICSVIVLAFAMDYEVMKTSPVALVGAGTGMGYSQMAITASSVAEFLRVMGYRGIPTGNDTALSIPYAIAAGLGELGRNGLLITWEYGPRIRIAKVFTDMKLIPDKPHPSGVFRFCRVCKKCAIHCPSRAISHEEPTWEGPTTSNNPGVFKWYINPEKCYKFWCANGNGCANCIKTCPYNKDFRRVYHRWARNLAPRMGSLLVWLDDIMGYGKQESPRKWWGL